MIEPVAWMIVGPHGECMGFLPTKEEGTVPVYPESALAAARAEALEEAAKVLEDRASALVDDGSVYACERAMELRVMQREIRALKGKKNAA